MIPHIATPAMPELLEIPPELIYGDPFRVQILSLRNLLRLLENELGKFEELRQNADVARLETARRLSTWCSNLAAMLGAMAYTMENGEV